MQSKIDYLRRAKVDLLICKKALDNWVDELEVDIAAYHLQQALEKTLKHKITLLGEAYPRTHEIKRLWAQLDKLNAPPPEWIWENHQLLTDFAEKTRYGENLVATQREVETFVSLLEAYMTDIEAATTVNAPHNPHAPMYHFQN